MFNKFPHLEITLTNPMKSPMFLSQITTFQWFSYAFPMVSFRASSASPDHRLHDLRSLHRQRRAAAQQGLPWLV